ESLPEPQQPGLPASPPPTIEDRLSQLPQEVQLDEALTADLRAELEKVAEARTEARKLADLRYGRHDIAWAKDYFSTLFPHVQDCREVARLLQLDAVLRAQEGDADGAILSARATLNAGRSISTEPLIISQLVRFACEMIAVRSMERTLAQGQPSETEL